MMEEERIVIFNKKTFKDQRENLFVYFEVWSWESDFLKVVRYEWSFVNIY